MIEVCGPEFFERVGGVGLESEIPVFIVGLPRSGTTLIEQILASHSQVFAAGEIKLASDTMATSGGPGARLRRGPSPVGPPDGPASRCPAPRETSRLESRCTTHRGQVAGQLPVAGSLGEPVSAGEVHSLPPRFARRGRLLLDDAFPRNSLGQRPAAHRFTVPRVPRIMEHWRKVLPAPMLEVDYEETVADLEGVARRLAAWCGLAWEPPAWSSTGRSGRSGRSAPSRSASRSSGHRWDAGSTTSRRWRRCSPGWSRRLGQDPGHPQETA